MSNGNADGERMMSYLPEKILSTTRVMVMMNFFPCKVTEVRRRVVWDIWGRGMNEKDISKGGKSRK